MCPDNIVPSVDLRTSRELLEGFANGAFSPIEVAGVALDQAEKLNQQLGAFLSTDRDTALSAARKAESRWQQWRRQQSTRTGAAEWQSLPIWGLPVSVKDTIEQADLPTTYGSLAFAENHQPDSGVIKVLRQSGCTLLGKTNTSEFALSMVTHTRLAPPARNPYDLTRTAGGSSGGAAAATASGIGTFGLGTDSVGSVRQPAAYCGLFGLKPTRGRIAVRQNWRASPTRSTLGPLAKDVSDLVISWRALTGDTEMVTALDSRNGPTKPLRVGLVAGDPDFGQVLSDAIERLEGTGVCEVTDASVHLVERPPTVTRDGYSVFAADQLSAANRLEEEFLLKHKQKLTSYAREILESGERIPAWEHRTVMANLEDYGDYVQDAFDNLDLVVTSVSEGAPVLKEPLSANDLGVDYPLLSVWNIAGNPALAIPLEPDSRGLPRSFQVVGRRGQDRQLLRLALSVARQSDEV